MYPNKIVNIAFVPNRYHADSLEGINNWIMCDSFSWLKIINKKGYKNSDLGTDFNGKASL